jgi:putative membrane protein
MNLILFLKGLLMGFADTVPGISGGTIAYITGIYEELIESIHSLNIKWVIPGIKGILGNKKEKNIATKHWKSMNLCFLENLAIGIVIAIGIGSFIFPYLLIKYEQQTLFFFIGLVLASAIILLKKVTWKEILLVLTGIILGLLTNLIPTVPNTLPFIFISGFIASAALLLPGISGAYILLLLGQYTGIYGALHEFNVPVLLTFVIGIGLGILAMSHILHAILKKWHTQTLAILGGLVLGSLWVPYKQATQIPIDWISIVLTIIGIIIPFVLYKWSNKK